MRWLLRSVWLVPAALAAFFWFHPPRGDDGYYHAMNAVEQVRAWHEGAVLPRHHRSWNGGTGSFAPTVYAPISQSVQGGLAWLVGDGQRAVGISLAAALLATAFALVVSSREPSGVFVIMTPYFLAVALSRSTTTEAWALVGAAAVLPLALPPLRLTQLRGLGLAAGFFLIAGCQVGMLLLLAWLLGTAWAVSELLGSRGADKASANGGHDFAEAAGWGLAGLCAAAVLWLPAVVDSRHLAITELVSGPLDWRRNFLPGGSELGLPLTATAAGLVVIALIVVVRGEGAQRLALASALAVGVALSTPLSAPLWHLPKMEILQLPWRSLGPSTVIAVLAIGSLRGRWRAAASAILLVPLVLLPVRVGTGDESVPAASTPQELAMIGHRQWGLAPILPSAAGLYAPEFHRIQSLQQLAHQRPQLTVIARDVGGGRWLVTSDEAGRALLPIQWWPEWRIEIDGRDRPYSNEKGLVAVGIEAGTTEVHASLARSRSRAAGMLISMVGVAALVLLTVRRGWDRDQRSDLRGAA